MNETSWISACVTTSNFTIEPDPDIAGIGVLVAFAASALFTLLFCVAYYCVNPEVSFTNDDGQNGLVHPVDKLCLDKLNALWTRTGRKSSGKWVQALEKAVLAFSDQQCITGTAILLSGYSQMFNSQNAKPMTIYDWRISVDLAWFSSITHLTTLTCLRHYFRQRRALSVFRIACMVVNAVILAVSIESTGWQIPNLGIPARCLYGPSSMWQHGGMQSIPVYNSLYTAITTTFLAFSYLTRTIQLCPYQSKIRRYSIMFVTFPIAFSDRLRRSTRERVLQSSKTLLFVHWLVYRLLVTVYCVLKAVFDLYSSMLWEITWLLIALVWGSLRVMTDRLGHEAYSIEVAIYFDSKGPHYEQALVLPTGNAWGFGQVIVIILLLLPFISFFEVVYDTVFSHGTPTSSADPHFDTMYITDSSVNAQHIPNPDQDLYRHRWFRMIILLIYGLSLAIAADLLFMFPYKRAVVTAGESPYIFDPELTLYPYASHFLVIHYARWYSLNIGLLGAFTFLVASIPDEDSRVRLQWIGHQVLLFFSSAMGQKTPASAALRLEKAWIATLTWYILIAGIIAGSIVYDWRWFQNFFQMIESNSRGGLSSRYAPT